MFLDELFSGVHVSLKMQFVAASASFETKTAELTEEEACAIEKEFKGKKYCVIEDVFGEEFDFNRHMKLSSFDMYYAKENTLPHRWAKVEITRVNLEKRTVCVVASENKSERCNRRGAHRQSTNLSATVYIRGIKDSICTTVKDLSAIGAGIILDRDMGKYVGNKCVLSIQMEDSTIKVPAKIVRSENDEKECVLGMKFRHYTDAIADYINSKQRDNILNHIKTSAA